MIHNGRQFDNRFRASRYHKMREINGCISLTQSQINHFTCRAIIVLNPELGLCMEDFIIPCTFVFTYLSSA